MGKQKIILTLILTLSLCLTQVGVGYGANETINKARSEVQKAFEAVVEAHNAGGNISALTDKLNEALSLISKAEEIADKDPNEAEKLVNESVTLAESILDEAPFVQEKGLEQRQMVTMKVAVSFIILGVAVALIYKYGLNALWRVWLRLRKNYKVMVDRPWIENKGSTITIEEILAGILVVIIIIAVFSTSQIFLGNRISEPFSELGVLGPNLKIGDYPKEVVAGETVKLYLYVGNHMGKPMYYAVMVKIGDNTTQVNPSQNEPVLKFEKVLLHNATWLFPANITLINPGINQRLIFELWIYNETIKQTQYHERWGQIWINVTSPPI